MTHTQTAPYLHSPFTPVSKNQDHCARSPCMTLEQKLPEPEPSTKSCCVVRFLSCCCRDDGEEKSLLYVYAARLLLFGFLRIIII